MIIIRLHKKIGDFSSTKSSFVNIFKMLISSLIMGALSYITFKTTNMRFSNTLSLMMSIAIAGISYLSCIIILKVDELNEIIAFYKNRRKNR